MLACRLDLSAQAEFAGTRVFLQSQIGYLTQNGRAHLSRLALEEGAS